MDGFLFGVFPYVALAVTVVGFFRRFRTMRYTVTTSSSQMLESRLQYWGSVRGTTPSSLSSSPTWARSSCPAL